MNDAPTCPTCGYPLLCWINMMDEPEVWRVACHHSKCDAFRDDITGKGATEKEAVERFIAKSLAGGAKS